MCLGVLHGEQLPVGALPTPARLSAPASFPDLSVTFRHPPRSFWGLLGPGSLRGLTISSSAALPLAGALPELGLAQRRRPSCPPGAPSAGPWAAASRASVYGP